MFLFTIADPSDDALRAQSDERYLDVFIQQNKRFILFQAARTLRRFITVNDDEWSIALIAFNEAVRTYDRSKGNFKTFAALVIKRRLIDYMKSEQRHAPEIPAGPSAMDGEPEDPDQASSFELEIREKSAELSGEGDRGEGVENPGSTPIRDEIEAMQQILGKYGFSFYDLVDASPKADKTKRACAAAVEVLLKNKHLFETMHGSGALPMKELCEISGISRKILERHRKYIIAAAEILNGEYPLLKEYMSGIRKQPEGT